jgi:hypothetical protein
MYMKLTYSVTVLISDWIVADACLRVWGWGCKRGGGSGAPKVRRRPTKTVLFCFHPRLRCSFSNLICYYIKFFSITWKSEPKGSKHRTPNLTLVSVRLLANQSFADSSGTTLLPEKAEWVGRRGLLFNFWPRIRVPHLWLPSVNPSWKNIVLIIN